MNVSQSSRILLAAVACAALLPAQGRDRLYDPATETVIKGRLENVTEPSRGQVSGMHLFIKTDEATIQVALGPSKFVKSEGFSFAKDDTVEVTGSKITIDAKTYVIAREVVKDGKTLVLRDKSGTPKWAGQLGRRHRVR